MTDAKQHTTKRTLLQQAGEVSKEGTQIHATFWGTRWYEVLAAWNACRHIPDPETTVPKLVEALQDLLSALDDAATETDDFQSYAQTNSYGPLADADKQARAALAGVKGEP